MEEITPTEPKANPVPQTGSGEGQSVSLNTSHIINICAVGIGVCFFLPWIHFWGGEPSGFDVAKTGGKYLILWIIPIFSVLTIFATITKRSAKIAAQLTGALPFAVLIYFLFQLGSELMKVLAF